MRLHFTSHSLNPLLRVTLASGVTVTVTISINRIKTVGTPPAVFFIAMIAQIWYKRGVRAAFLAAQLAIL